MLGSPPSPRGERRASAEGSLISKRDVQLGKIALKAGFVTKDQITRCLALQKKLAKEKGKKVALGSLLLKKGYIDKDQLEEIVRLHNAALEKAGGASEASGEVTASAEGEDDAAAKKLAAAKAKKKAAAKAKAKKLAEAKKKKAREQAEASGEEPSAGAASAEEAGAESAPPAEERKRSRTSARAKSAAAGKASRDKADKADRAKADKREKKAKTSTRTSARTSARASKAGPSTASEADASLFLSAPEDAVDEEDRRLIACPDCAKKYRVRADQVGKRFNCRRCKFRIKVPKDLFERPSEVGAAAPAVEVEEFLLSSSDAEPAGEGDEEAKVAVAAAKAATAVAKVGQQSQRSIADLAAAAATRKAKPLAPRAKFGVLQALTALASLTVITVLVGGTWYYFDQQEQARLVDIERRIKEELAGWTQRLDRALARAKEAGERGDPHGIRTALSALELVRTAERSKLVQRGNQAASAAYEEQVGVVAQMRDLFLRQGDLLLEAGGPTAAEDALIAYGRAEEVAPGHAATQLKLVRTRIRARQFEAAAKGIAALAQKDDTAHALEGLAWELGGAADSAVAAYEKLSDPLGPVLAARALVVAGDAGKAIGRLDRVQGLQGLDLAAAKVVEGLAYEVRDDAERALRAFELAVAADAETPFPRIARAEFFARQGRLREALADLKQANRISATAAGLVAEGKLHLALLDAEEGLTALRAALQATPLPGARRVAGEVDPFGLPTAPDPHAEARVLLALADAARGDSDSARRALGQVVQDYPFSPYGYAGFVQLQLFSAKDARELDPLAESYVSRAISLARKIGGSDPIPSRESGFVLLVQGRLQMLRARRAEALTSFEQAARLAPDLASDAWTLAGRTLIDQSLMTKALLELQRAVERTRTSGSYKAAREAIAAGRSKQASEGLRVLLALHPYDSLLWVALAEAQRSTAPVEAKAALDRAIELNPALAEAFRARALLQLRDLPEGQRDVERGGQDAQQAREIEERRGSLTAPTLYALALYLRIRQDTKGALETLGRCIELDREFAEAYRLRAEVARAAGDTKQADADQKEWERLRQPTK